MKAALARLRAEPGHVAMEAGHLAMAGHSMGGVLAASLAALAAQSGIPQPLAVMCIEPGKTWGLRPIRFVLPDLSRIPPETLLLAVAGDEDTVVNDTDALRIFRESTAVPAGNKDFITLRSDRHGHPPLIADHFAPCAASPGVALCPLLPRGCARLLRHLETLRRVSWTPLSPIATVTTPWAARHTSVIWAVGATATPSRNSASPRAEPWTFYEPAARNTMQTGACTSTLFPVGVSFPVLRFTRNITMLLVF